MLRSKSDSRDDALFREASGLGALWTMLQVAQGRAHQLGARAEMASLEAACEFYDRADAIHAKVDPLRSLHASLSSLSSEEQWHAFLTSYVDDMPGHCVDPYETIMDCACALVATEPLGSDVQRGAESLIADLESAVCDNPATRRQAHDRISAYPTVYPAGLTVVAQQAATSDGRAQCALPWPRP